MIKHLPTLFALSWLFAPAAVAQTPVAQTQDTPQSEPAAPTVRYARGEDVPLAEIISEWRGYYADIPVYLCVCQNDTCDQTEQWPNREYARYQLGLALGPTNGRIAESAGSNCFDIADNSRPSAPRAFSPAQTGGGETVAQNPAPPAAPPVAPPAESAVQTPPPQNADAVTAPVAPPAAPPAPQSPPAPAAPPSPPAPASPATGGIPTATTINGGAGIRLAWPSGATNDIAIAGSTWNINILDALDCASTSVVDSRTLSAQRVVGAVAVDSETGNIAIPVLLDSCIDTDQSAVFILDPSEGGGYALYRTQLPGPRSFPDEFSSYAFNSIVDVSYGKGVLYIQEGTASGAEAVSIFRTNGTTPAGSYLGCSILTNNEGANRLCPTSSAVGPS